MEKNKTESISTHSVKNLKWSHAGMEARWLIRSGDHLMGTRKTRDNKFAVRIPTKWPKDSSKADKEEGNRLDG